MNALGLFEDCMQWKLKLKQYPVSTQKPQCHTKKPIQFPWA